MYVPMVECYCAFIEELVYHSHSGSNLIHNKNFIVNCSSPHAAKWLRC